MSGLKENELLFEDILEEYFGLINRVFNNGPGDLGSIPSRVIPNDSKYGT